MGRFSRVSLGLEMLSCFSVEKIVLGQFVFLNALCWLMNFTVHVVVCGHWAGRVGGNVVGHK